tara:strand:- start:1134 stop:1880 length:747 start_codon:yes stop_codon:yes gene_type:complete
MAKQINDNGIALVSGLDIYTPLTVFSDEKVSYGSYFISNSISNTLISTNTEAYATQAVSSASLPKFTNSKWYRYGTSGTVYSSIGESQPATTDNKLTLTAIVGGELGTSHSGVFQELKNLIVGQDYRITIDLHPTTAAGTLAVSRLYNDTSVSDVITLIQSSVSSFSLPDSDGVINLDFNAYSTSDILFIDYSSSVNEATVDISSISVKMKNDYQVPVLMENKYSGYSKILRRKYSNSIPLEEGDTGE